MTARRAGRFFTFDRQSYRALSDEYWSWSWSGDVNMTMPSERVRAVGAFVTDPDSSIRYTTGESADLKPDEIAQVKKMANAGRVDCNASTGRASAYQNLLDSQRAVLRAEKFSWLDDPTSRWHHRHWQLPLFAAHAMHWGKSYSIALCDRLLGDDDNVRKAIWGVMETFSAQFPKLPNEARIGSRGYSSVIYDLGKDVEHTKPEDHQGLIVNCVGEPTVLALRGPRLGGSDGPPGLADRRRLGLSARLRERARWRGTRPRRTRSRHHRTDGRDARLPSRLSGRTPNLAV